MRCANADSPLFPHRWELYSPLFLQAAFCRKHKLEAAAGRYTLSPAVPVFVSLSDLKEDAFVKILTEPKNALVKQYKKLFKMDNIELVFEPDAVDAVAHKASELKTGARGLRAILEDAMQDVMFTSPSNVDIDKIVITKNVILNHSKPEIIYKIKSEETA